MCDLWMVLFHLSQFQVEILSSQKCHLLTEYMNMTLSQNHNLVILLELKRKQHNNNFLVVELNRGSSLLHYLSKSVCTL